MIHFCISVTVVQDDDLVEEPFEEPSDEPSGTRTPPTPVVSPSPAPAPPPPVPPTFVVLFLGAALYRAHVGGWRRTAGGI